MGSLKKLWGWCPTGKEWVKLQVDSTGKVLISSIQTKASAYLSANQLNLTSGVTTKINLDVVLYDVGSNFNTVNSKFIAPFPGYYLIQASIGYSSAVVDKYYDVIVYKSAVIVIFNRVTLSMLTVPMPFVAKVLHLDEDDCIELKGRHGAGVDTVDVNSDHFQTFLTIHLLSV